MLPMYLLFQKKEESLMREMPCVAMYICMYYVSVVQ